MIITTEDGNKYDTNELEKKFGGPISANRTYWECGEYALNNVVDEGGNIIGNTLQLNPGDSYKEMWVAPAIDADGNKYTVVRYYPLVKGEEKEDVDPFDIFGGLPDEIRPEGESLVWEQNAI